MIRRTVSNRSEHGQKKSSHLSRRRTWMVWSAQLSMLTVPCSTPFHAGCESVTISDSRTSQEWAEARKQAPV
jgi:hypothetical protein